MKLLNAGRYAHIDAMRAVAVMLVVVSHAGLGDIVPGGSGVTIFFGISGFIITYLLLRERSRTGGFNIGAFYERRALKILPPLFVIIVIPTLIVGAFSAIQWKPLLGIIFFYFNWLFLGGTQPQLAGSGVVWSLSIEEQFYLVFAFVWFVFLSLGLRMRWLAAGALFVALSSLAIKIAIVTSNPHSIALENRVYFGTDTRIDAIACGVLTAMCFHYGANGSTPGRMLNRVITLCQKDSAVIVGLLVFTATLVFRNEWFRYTFRFSAQALVACLFILYGFGEAATPVRRSFNYLVRLKPVQLIGLASYSIYLIHFIAITPAIPLLAGLNSLVRMPILVLLGTGCGIVAYLLIERPIQLWRTRSHHAASSA